MKKYMTLKILAVLLAAGTLSGCSGKNGDLKSGQETFSVVKNNRMQVKEEGIFYIDGYTERMMFYDFGLGEAIPICDRPNCGHNDSGCGAYFSQGYMSGMGCYQDKLYYYDNMDPKIPFYQCEKSGGGRKRIASLNGDKAYGSLSVSLPMFFVEDTVCFGLTETRFLTEPVTKEDGTVKSEECFFMIGKLNLEDGSFEIVKEREAYDHYEEGFEISDYADGRIFYSKRKYAKTRDSSAKNEIRAFDIKTGTDETLFEGKEEMGYLGSIRDEHKVFYVEEGHVYAVDAETKDTEIVFEKEAEEGKELDWLMGDGTIFVCSFPKGTGTAKGETFFSYDVNAKKERRIEKEEYSYAPFLAATKDWYVASTELGMVCISKEAYTKKEWDKAQVIGFF